MTVSRVHFDFARSQALLGNVALQAGACLVGSQSRDWELVRWLRLIWSDKPFMPFMPRGCRG